MAIYIHCPHCHQCLEEMHAECRHCGASLPPGVLYALACALEGGDAVAPVGTSPLSQSVRSVTSPLAAQLLASAATTPPHYSALRPWLAALLSLFCGAGQLYNGQIRKGILLLCSGVVAVLLWPWLLGKVLAIGLWVYATADAYVAARRLLQ